MGSVVAGALAKGVFTKLLAELHSLASGPVKKRFHAMKNAQRSEAILERLQRVRWVKTIWQFEREVDLLSFYCPTSVAWTSATHGARRRVFESLDSIRYEGHLLVCGTAGQGKSSLARYLAVVEAGRGRYLPVFLELRSLGDRSLVDAAVEYLRSCKMSVDRETLEFISGTGKLLIVLDGFDEVADDSQSRVVAEIEAAMRELEGTRILVTTRPGTGIEAVAGLRLLRVCQLQGDDYKGVVRALEADEGTASEVIAQVERKKDVLGGLLTTPLMVGLLVFRFRVDQTVPESMLGFYKDLFPTMLLRHDNTKPGYRRERRSGISDYDAERVFDAFCFLSRQTNQSSFERRQALDMMGHALRVLRRDYDPGLVLGDVRKVTCLVLLDGSDYTFLHKSVQEFHCAQFVASAGTSLASRFYAAARRRSERWLVELEFLERLDPVRFAELFAIPLLRSELGAGGGVEDVDPSAVPRSELLAWIRDVVGFLMREEGPGWVSLTTVQLGWLRAPMSGLFEACHALNLAALNEGDVAVDEWLPGTLPRPDWVSDDPEFESLGAGSPWSDPTIRHVEFSDLSDDLIPEDLLVEARRAIGLLQERLLAAGEVVQRNNELETFFDGAL